jgi:hypothetical protein
MKTLSYLIVLAVLVIAGCVTDDTMFETQNSLELKKAKVPIPMKMDCRAVPDTESDLLPVVIGDNTVYIYSRLIISGTGTHLGKIEAEKSFYVIKNGEFFINDDGIPSVRNSGDGKVVGANGDGFEFTWWIKESLVDYTFFGEMEITPGTGTGKFEGCSGSCDIVGMEPAVGLILFNLDGYLVYK